MYLRSYSALLSCNENLFLFTHAWLVTKLFLFVLSVNSKRWFADKLGYPPGSMRLANAWRPISSTSKLGIYSLLFLSSCKTIIPICQSRARCASIKKRGTGAYSMVAAEMDNSETPFRIFLLLRSLICCGLFYTAFSRPSTIRYASSLVFERSDVGLMNSSPFGHPITLASPWRQTPGCMDTWNMHSSPETNNRKRFFLRYSPFSTSHEEQPPSAQIASQPHAHQISPPSALSLKTDNSYFFVSSVSLLAQRDLFCLSPWSLLLSFRVLRQWRKICIADKLTILSTIYVKHRRSLL